MSNPPFSTNLVNMRFPPANVPVRILRPNTSRRLGLIDQDPGAPPRDPEMLISNGSYTYGQPLSRHGLIKIPNPLNWQPELRTFSPSDPTFYPAELRIPKYLYSFESMLFLGFSYDTALVVWNEFIASGQNEGGPFGLPRFLISYMYAKGVADGVEKYNEVKQLTGFDPRGTSYAGFWPGLKDLEGLDPELPASAHENDYQRRLYGGSTVKLHHWAYCLILNRFVFLAILTHIFDVVEEVEFTESSNPEPLALWVETIYKMQNLALHMGLFPC